jgi:hypothetical protein
VPPVYGIGLVRVSDEDDARDGLSLDTQSANIPKYCKRAKILLLKTYVEGGVRGWKEREERAAYAEALAHAKRLRREGKRVVFIVCYVDRLGRNRVEQDKAIEELLDADIPVHTAVEFGGAPLPEDISPLMTWLAARRIQEQGLKVGDVWAHTRSLGWGFIGRKLWGYDHRDRTEEEQAAGAPEKVRIAHPIEAPFARKALERLAAGESAAAVHGWVASLPATARGGRVLGYTTFVQTMQSPTYVGRPSAAEGRPRQPGRFAKRLWRRDDAPKLPETPEEVLALPPGRWKPLVSDETWLKAQHTLSSRRRPRGRPATNGRYKLTGLTRCPVCDSRMVGRPASDGRTFRYVCTAWLQKTVDRAPGPDGKVCRFSCSGPSLEGAVIEEFARLLGALFPKDPARRAGVGRVWEDLRQRRPEEDGAVLVVREALARIRRGEKAVHQRLAGYVDLLLKKQISQTAYDAAQAEAQTELDRAQTEERQLRAELTRLTGGRADGHQEPVLPPWEEVEADFASAGTDDWRVFLKEGAGASWFARFVEAVIPQRKSYGDYGAEYRRTRLGKALCAAAEMVAKTAP